MRLTDEDLTELQRLYKKRFGKDLSRIEAEEKGLHILTCIKYSIERKPNNAIPGNNTH